MMRACNVAFGIVKFYLSKDIDRTIGIGHV